jgi:23S rRNA pseudouridine1911/1915/1917 synthase
MQKKKKSASSEAPTPESQSTTASSPRKKPPAASTSLLERLKEKYPEVSTNTLKQWIKFERVDPATLNILPKKENVEGVDTHLIVVDKPYGLLSVASDTEKHSMHNLLKIHYYPRQIGVIHRLDEGTSGVMIFTFTDAAYQGLKDQFKDHSIERYYLGVVEGEFTQDEGTWDTYLYEDSAMKVRITQDETQGERAITHYKKLASSPEYSLLQFKLKTGKKNQIRVQCAAVGHPIVGDKKYGATGDPIKRLALHAEHLSFTHPVTKKRMTFTSQPTRRFFMNLRD